MSETESSLTGSPERWVWFFGGGSAEGDPARRDLLGGKGASLAAMCRAGLPAPPGFTISTAACARYHAADGAWPAGLADEVQRNLAALERATGLTFGDAARPLLVSVRSGAAVSMPGMMDTILNCGLDASMATAAADAADFWRVYAQFVRQFGKTVADIPDAAFEAAAGADDEASSAAWIDLYAERTGRAFPATAAATLTESIGAVFDSWNNERAKIYRRAHDIRGLAGTAVTVQAMFHSQVSGVAFTANPSRPRAGEIVIESSFGLGEAIVSGEVTPDRFVLDEADFAVKERVIGRKGRGMAALGSGAAAPAVDEASLTDEQIERVGRLAAKTAEHFGFPVDIEWALVGDELTLLQSRPIRGLDVAMDVETGRREEIDRLRRCCGDREKVWVLHNLAETLPAPTPLTWDIVGAFMTGDGGYGRMYRQFGYRPSRQTREEGFLDLICGRIYVDPDRAAGLFWGSMPFQYDHQAILENPAVLETAPTTFNADKADGKFFLRLPGAIWAMVRSARTLRRARRSARETFENEVLPPYLAYLDERRAMDLAATPTGELTAELRGRIERIMHQFGADSLKPGFFGGLARAELEQLLCQLAGPSEGARLCLGLTAGLPGDSTVEQNIMLHDVSGGAVSMETFLATYGHRAAGEMELARPRWREDDAYLRAAVARFAGGGAADPRARHEAKRADRERLEAELPERLGQWGGTFLAERIEKLLREAQTLLPYREVGKHYLMMGYELIREAIVELGRRWDLSRDVFFLHLDELDRFEAERDAMVERIARRKVRWRSAQRLDPPGVIRSDQLEDLGLPRRIEGSAEMDAAPLAAGLATGPVKIIHHPDQADQLPERCILVCPSTDPGWTALFGSIAGLIVERGGVLSHGAITARDFGVPAVACPDATQRIADGAVVRVDGDRGQVTIVEAQT